MSSKAILIYVRPGRIRDLGIANVILSIRNMGFISVVVSPSSSNCEADFCYENPSWSYDYVFELSRKHNICLALALTDFASPIVARLNEELGLPGPRKSQIWAIHEKLNWSQHIEHAGLDQIKEYLINDENGFLNCKIEGPIFVKPSRSAGNYSDKTFGYKSYSCIADFYSNLKVTNQLQEFFDVNRNGSYLGKYLIQENIQYKSWQTVNFVIGSSDVDFWECSNQVLEPYPRQQNFIETYGRVVPSSAAVKYIEEIFSVLINKIGIRFMCGSFDVVEACDGRWLTPDLNTRFASTWLGFLGLRDALGFFQSVVEKFLGGEENLPKIEKYFLRASLVPPAGVIHSIVLPEDHKSCQILGRDEYSVGDIVPVNPCRNNFGLEALIVEDSPALCRDQLILCEAQAKFNSNAH